MNTSLKSTVLGAVMASLLAGCAVGTPYQRPDVAMPAQWDGVVAAKASGSAAKDVADSATATADWWRQFGSAELDQLMERALAANHDLAAATIRIRQARASAGITDAGRLPTADLSASGTRSHSNQAGGSTSEQSQLGVSIAYEVDLWGGKAAQSQAANARVDANTYDRDAVALVLQADVAANYFQALALNDRLAIARKNLEAARSVLSLVEVRYNKGATTGLEVAQQRTSVLNIEAQIPQLEQELRAKQTALAVLLGQAPQGFSIQGNSLAGMHLPAVATEQPASLLERRPDIKRAESRLVAANADINAARAALYPHVRLSASAVASGIVTGGSNVVGSLLASLTQSLFDGGRLRGQVDLSQAQRDELVEQYLQSVLVSLKEVQDSLHAVTTAQARQGLLTDAASEAKEAFRIANVRYQAGSQDLLTLLDSQRTQLQAEDSRVQAELARYTATINLYKSLGGGWKSA
ncbi:NodT family efflux transporter outer membrane factor (OMF) lipoprotein [Paucimonas lemoignei]|uniref:NodT family efflux transporter outer membrane factor (OMF) lipoprotein n=1 Tax=Paucimonas lemoignei TaxID=29443 RepID=A0A4R3HVQ2_PAULE|nr:efflux transporter outer membrane subunit [Paucimonas lemoignei]TCS36301.1 NodT family efflux transporter outer membrane factor (OMF) lipoprotein [Paucimonas lemoignei]